MNADNRRYEYNCDGDFSIRPEYQVITDWITQGASVLDLACGDGALMHFLKETRDVTIEGIERSESGVGKARAHGMQARVGDIDSEESYRNYTDNSFDFAVCNVTLQMVMYPEVLIGEMKRVAKRQIISFPNFGHLFNRLDLLFTGRMPRPQMFGYRWYDTGQIHQLGIGDFRLLCSRHALRVVDSTHQGRPVALANLLPSLFSRTAILLCEAE